MCRLAINAVFARTLDYSSELHSLFFSLLVCMDTRVSRRTLSDIKLRQVKLVSSSSVVCQKQGSVRSAIFFPSDHCSD